MKLYNVLQGSRMATRRLPATPILLFLVSNHCRSSTYIHKHQCARETVV